MRRFRIDRFILSICAIDGIYRFVSSIVSIDLCHRWYLSICIVVVSIDLCHRWYSRNLRNRDRTDANPDPFRMCYHAFFCTRGRGSGCGVYSCRLKCLQWILLISNFRYKISLSLYSGPVEIASETTCYRLPQD